MEYRGHQKGLQEGSKAYLCIFFAFVRVFRMSSLGFRWPDDAFFVQFNRLVSIRQDTQDPTGTYDQRKLGILGLRLSVLLFRVPSKVSHRFLRESQSYNGLGEFHEAQGRKPGSHEQN